MLGWQDVKYDCVSESSKKFRPHALPIVITCAVCIAANIGMAFSRDCLFTHGLKGKWLELSTPNLVHIYSIVKSLGMP